LWRVNFIGIPANSLLLIQPDFSVRVTKKVTKTFGGLQGGIPHLPTKPPPSYIREFFKTRKNNGPSNHLQPRANARSRGDE
jgi:hypothetical protein